MALNEILRDGFRFSVSFGAVDPAVESGDFVVLDGIRGVAETDSRLGDNGDYVASISTIGVYAGTTADAVAVGEAVYLAAAATAGTALTVTALGNELVGYAIAAKGAGAGDVWVRVNN